MKEKNFFSQGDNDSIMIRTTTWIDKDVAHINIYAYGEFCKWQKQSSQILRCATNEKKNFFQGDNDMDSNESGRRLIVSAWDEEGLIM